MLVRAMTARTSWPLASASSCTRRRCRIAGPLSPSEKARLPRKSATQVATPRGPGLRHRLVDQPLRLLEGGLAPADLRVDQRQPQAQRACVRFAERQFALG